MSPPIGGEAKADKQDGGLGKLLASSYNFTPLVASIVADEELTRLQRVSPIFFPCQDVVIRRLHAMLFQ